MKYLKIKKKKIINPFIFLIQTFIFTFPFIKGDQNLSIQDWDQQLAYLESARKTVTEFHGILNA